MIRELWHELQRRGFTPDDDGGDWATLDVGTAGVLSVPRSKVRVEWDDGTVIVYVMTGNAALLWDARLTGAPLSVATTVIDLAIARALTSGGDET